MSANKIKQSALYYLAQREHSQQELLIKLERKGYSIQDIRPVLLELSQSKLQSDQRFAESYTYSRHRKGYGPIRIKQELQNKGLKTEIIAEAIKITDNEWLIAAKALWHKRFGNQQATDFKALAKQMRFLQYRGYTREQIEQILNDSEQ